MSGLSGNGRAAPAVYARYENCPRLRRLLASSRCRDRLRGQRRLAGADRARREAVHRTGTPDLHLTTFDGAIEIRSWDRPDVLVEIEKRGADARSGRRAGRRGRAGRQPDRGRGQAAEAETLQRLRVPPVRLGEADRVGPAERECRRPERRRVDPDRARDRPARAAHRRRQHPRVRRGGDHDAPHRRRIGHVDDGEGAARCRHRRRQRRGLRQADGRQAAHRRRIDRLSRRSRRRR